METHTVMFAIRPFSRNGVLNGSKYFKRSIFTVSELPNLDISKGVPGLLSPKGLDVAWTQYQKHLIDKLNSLVETSAENLTLFELVRNTDHNPDLAEINYYASQAYNNEFFFSSLKPSTNRDADVSPPTAKESRQVNISSSLIYNPLPEDHRADSYSSNNNNSHTVSSPEQQQRAAFRAAINDSFDSDIAFSELLVSRADAMFGNGYVWLVQAIPYGNANNGGLRSIGNSASNNGGGLFLVNTYNSATPFAKQPLEPSSEDSHQNMRVNSLSAQGKVADLGKPPTLRPLLNVHGWQHVYLTDYGISGKRKYLENLFNCIDWSILAKRASM